ncbi:hypothetical protein [Flavihumibacter solisilvae]|jgi:hypothetical protein|uniref:Sugar 3,4-ketoisomerase QdtA cupin domain-containing protein n=1 Tax=Flavihumibacter solisilvae TaxID=1349421 RepID=A0A0C1IKC7_9BACT|nr:hypothetical protein [Flavihumibacter solisilvae]KIC94635.1 hypothetical protein OI18_11125 [Flavihumibacter solisilvae]
MLTETTLGVEVIFDKDNTIPICHIIRAGYAPENTEFFTPGNYSQQLGIIKYPKGGSIKPHYHNKVVREVHFTQEVLVIRKGKVKVNLFDHELQYITHVVLSRGDVILLASGGHGFEMLEDSEMLEVKQGPYNGVQADKTHF